MVEQEGERSPESAERSMWEQLAGAVERFQDEVRDLPVHSQASSREVRSTLRRYDFQQPIPREQLTDEVEALLRKWTTHITHPRYFGLFNPSVLPVSVVADALAGLYNPQLAAWTHAPAVNEIERLTLHALMSLFGWQTDEGWANFTSGGAEANTSAVLAAIAHRFPETSTAGMSALRERPAIYLTSQAHHSFAKTARMTGLGTDSLREVPTTDRHTLDPAALREQIAADRQAGWEPLLIVGTAGTTGAGLIDPLPEIADIARAADVWFHVDAAWGGGALLSPKLRPLLVGIERADSVTWDAHKWLSVPMGAGMFFCRHKDAVKRAFAVSTSYMPAKAEEEDSYDPYATTIQWSRRATGLKVFMALAEQGMAGYAALIEHQAAMGDLLREALRQAGWLVRNGTALPVVCFTHADIASGRCTTQDVLRVIYQRSRVWISDVVLGGSERVLRACITSYKTEPGDIDVLVEELEKAITLGGRRDLRSSREGGVSPCRSGT